MATMAVDIRVLDALGRLDARYVVIRETMMDGSGDDKCLVPAEGLQAIVNVGCGSRVEECAAKCLQLDPRQPVASSKSLCPVEMNPLVGCDLVECAVGDIVRGASLVVWAIRDGREAADAILDYLAQPAAVAAE